MLLTLIHFSPSRLAHLCFYGCSRRGRTTCRLLITLCFRLCVILLCFFHFHVHIFICCERLHSFFKIFFLFLYENFIATCMQIRPWPLSKICSIDSYGTTWPEENRVAAIAMGATICNSTNGEPPNSRTNLRPTFHFSSVF